MKRSRYFWMVLNVIGEIFVTITFGYITYATWHYIFRTPNTEWLFLAGAWFWLFASLVILTEKGYRFTKWMFSASVKVDRQESSRSQPLGSSSEQVGDSIKNIFDDLPQHIPKEVVQTLIRAADVRIERIISHGHASAPDFWYDQPQHEWVIVLKGAARLQFEDGMVEMKVGDFINIPAFKKHRVDWTTPDEPTVWLGVRNGGT